MERRAPSPWSLCLAGLLAAFLSLAWLAGWVLERQGLRAEALSGPGGEVRQAALWHTPRFSVLEPPPLAEAGPLHLRLTGFFHPPRGGTWRAALVGRGRDSLSLAGVEWDAPPLAQEPAPAWTASASQGHGAELAFDRDPATRYSSDAPQRGGEGLTLDLGSPRAVLGVILDAQGAGNDSPAALTVELSGDGKLFAPAVRAGGFPRGQGLVEAFFPSLQARWLRLTQDGRRPGFFWSLHEVYVVDEEMLERRSRAVELTEAPQPIRLLLSTDAQHPDGAEGHLLGRVFVRPPQGPWQELPPHRLSPGPQAAPPWLAWLALAARPWLPGLALALAALLCISLYRDWLWPEE